MNRSPVWIALMILIGAAALWHTGVISYRGFNYFLLSRSAPAVVTNWTIHEIDDEEFGVAASYTFQHDKKEYEGETLFKNAAFERPFRNPWAAKEELDKKKLLSWEVWYSPSNPHYSTLQKSFPIKECVSAGVLWALFIYFFWLGCYVSQKQH